MDRLGIRVLDAGRAAPRRRRVQSDSEMSRHSQYTATVPDESSDDEDDPRRVSRHARRGGYASRRATGSSAATTSIGSVSSVGTYRIVQAERTFVSPASATSFVPSPVHPPQPQPRSRRSRHGLGAIDELSSEWNRGPFEPSPLVPPPAPVGGRSLRTVPGFAAPRRVPVQHDPRANGAMVPFPGAAAPGTFLSDPQFHVGSRSYPDRLIPESSEGRARRIALLHGFRQCSPSNCIKSGTTLRSRCIGATEKQRFLGFAICAWRIVNV